jgi:SulP family sulfate permease
MMALLRELLPNFSWLKSLKGNLSNEMFASFVGALLVIPQAISFAYLAGLPPEYGIYGAIFVTFIASLFGSTPMLGGPNTAVAILIGLAVAPYAGRGSPLFIEYVLILSIMVGVIQLIFWLLRGAKIFDFFNPAAIVGLTTGVGFILMISSLDGMFGISRTYTTFFYEKIYILFSSFHDLTNMFALSIALFTVLVGIISKHYFNKYYILFAIMFGLLFSSIIISLYPQLISDVELLGYIPMDPSFAIPTFTDEHLVVAEMLLYDAIIIAFVGISQSVIITKDLSSSLNKSFNQNKEIYAQGISNFFSGFFGAFAGSGSFNRTAVNLELNSKSKLPGLMSSFFIVFIILVLNPFLAHTPMAVISAILFLVGLAMIKPALIKSYFYDKKDTVMLFSVFLITIIIGLKAGIIASFVFSVIIFTIRTSSIEHHYSVHGETNILKISGNLFYTTADQLRTILQNSPKNITLDINDVGFLDRGTIKQVFAFAESRISKDDKFVIFCEDLERCQFIKDNKNNVPVFSNFTQIRDYFS